MTLIVDALPKEVEDVHATLTAALARRLDLQRLVEEAVAAEPAYSRALDVARAAAAEAEMDWALATDETEKKLRGVRDRLRGECSEAEDALKRAQYLPVGLTRRAAEADDDILAAKSPFEAAVKPFCDYVLAEFRKLHHGSVFGGECWMLPVRVLQLAHALHDALPFPGTLRLVRDGVDIPDLGPVPGRPVPRLIQGDRCWPDDDNIAGASLRHWQDDAEIVALHRLLRPLSVTFEAAARWVRKIEATRAAAPAPVPPAPPEPPKMTGEEWSASQPTEAEHRAEMQRIRAEQHKAAGVTPPVRHTFSEPYSNPDRFDGARLA